MNLQLVQKTLQTHLLHMKNLLKLGLAKKVIISVIFLTYLTPLSDPAELFGTPPPTYLAVKTMEQGVPCNYWDTVRRNKMSDFWFDVQGWLFVFIFW